MTLIATVMIALLNILTNHTMLTRKRSIPYCAIAFIVNTLLVLILGIYFRNRITDLMVYKYVFYAIAFIYIGYIYMVFSDAFSIKLFSMLSVWGFSTIITSVSNMIYDLLGGYSLNVYVVNAFRIILQLLLLRMAYKWYGNYFKAVLGKININIINLMSGYMLIALLLLINSFAWNNIYLSNTGSVVDISLIIIFIVLGYFIAFFGIASSSKNTLLKQNMSTLKEQSDIYYKLANYDDLTGIASRQNTIEQISQTLNDCQSTNTKCILFMFDIDKFKDINDRYGHAMGDTALKYVIKRVKNCLREEDLIGRMGGDEFVIFPKSIHTAEEARSLVRRIKDVLKTPLIIDEASIPIDISIGVSVFPTDAQEMDDLFNQADQAMYQAKKGAGTTYEFFNEAQYT